MSPGTPVPLTTLRAAAAVCARELGAAFDSPIAYVATIAALLASSSVFLNEFFLAGKLDLTPFFDLLPLVFTVYVPALAMRAWSEDLRTRTFELWMTWPLSARALVLGKFGAGLVLLATFLAGTLPLVGLCLYLGQPDLGRIAAGYLGAFLLGALFLAAGSLFSALSADQIVAFLCGAFVCFLLVALGEERTVAILDGAAPGWRVGTRLADGFSALPPYEAFVRGLVPLAALAHLVGLTVLCLGLTVLAVRKNRT